MSYPLSKWHSWAAGIVCALLPVVSQAQTTNVEPMLPAAGGGVQPMQVGGPSTPAGMDAGSMRPGNIRDVYGSYEGGFPTTDVRIAVDANARAAFARMEMARSQDELNGTIRLMQMQFERSKDLTDAQAAEQQAYDDYLVARDAVLKSRLQNDPTYAGNAAVKQDLANEIADARQAAKPNQHQIVALSRAKLNYAQIVTDLESKALRDDAGVQAARKKLMTAGQRVAELRDKFDMQIRTSPELVALRRQYEDARIANVVAATYRQGAVQAANIAIDYAYYRERYNYYNAYPYNNCPQSIYGGYGTGYPVNPRY